MIEARCIPSKSYCNTIVIHMRSLDQKYSEMACVHTYNIYTGRITMSVGKLPKDLYIDMVKGLADIIDQIDDTGVPKHAFTVQLTD